MRKMCCLGMAVAAGLLLTWSAPAIQFQATDVRLDKGAGTVSSNDVSLATNGSGAIYAGWLDYRNGPNMAYFNYSLDYGQTWGGTDAQFSAVTSQDLMVISGGGNKVYAIWAEYGASNRNIMFRYSANNGVNWSSPAQVNTTTDGNMERCKLAYCGDNVYAVWKRYASGNNGILFRRSTDGGANWEGTDAEFSWGTVDYPTMVADSSGNIYVAWQKWDDDDVYFKYSDDYGEVWSEQTKLNNATGGTQEFINLGYSGNNVYAVWKDGWFPHTVRFDRSTNNGQTWGNPDTNINTQTEGNYYINRAYMANGANGEVYGIWTDSREENGDVRNIYFNSSPDYGESWQPAHVRMTTFSADYGKVIAGSSGQVYAVYEDTQTVDTLYCQASSDTGETWDSGIKVSNESPNDGSQRYFGLSVDAQNLYVAWREARTGVYGVFFNYALIGEAATPTYRIDSGDYNGDGTSDIGVFRPAQGLWSIRNVTRAYLGNSTDVPVCADYNGDGTSDIAIYRGSQGLWSVRNLSRFYLGNSTDYLVPGDYNATGSAQAAIFRPSNGTWAIRDLTRFYFGNSTDEVVPGPYDVSYCQPAIFRPSTGLWSVRDVTRFYMGASTDSPVPGAYQGGETWDGAVYRPSTGLWSIRNVTRAYFGGATDYPLPAKYSGSASDQIGIFRPSQGLWSVRDLTRVYFGAAGDYPVTR